MKTPEEVTSRAAAIIEQRGWWQGAAQGPDGQCCLARALAKACMEATAGVEEVRQLSKEQVPAYLELVDSTHALVRRRLGQPHDFPLITWNDAEEREEAEVLAVLRGEPS